MSSTLAPARPPCYTPAHGSARMPPTDTIATPPGTGLLRSARARLRWLRVPYADTAILELFGRFGIWPANHGIRPPK
jgi:hypothetical protein